MENPSAKEIWDKASQLIKSEINGISYDSWFKDIVPVSFDGQVLTLLVNIEFIRNMLRNNYDQLIQAALMQAAGQPVHIGLELFVFQQQTGRGQRSKCGHLFLLVGNRYRGVVAVNVSGGRSCSH